MTATFHLDSFSRDRAVDQLPSLIDLVQWQAANNPGKGYIFLEDGEEDESRMSFADLDRRARAIAAHLQQQTVPGERALLLYPPGLDYIAAFFGCLYAGVVAVPAYPPRPNRSLERLQSVVADSGAALILAPQKVHSGMQRQLADAPELDNLIWIDTDQIETGLSTQWQRPPCGPDTLAFLQYTSGSTGTPKGVMVSHGNLLHNLRMVYHSFGHTPDTVFAGWLPLYHDMGLIGNVMQPLYIGNDCILMSPFSFLSKPIRWLKAISRYKATTSGGPDFAYDLCARKITDEQCEGLDLRSWQVAYNGAEPVRAATLERFAARFAPYGFKSKAFYPCYGMAESTLFITGGSPHKEASVLPVQDKALECGHALAVGTGASARPLVGCGITTPDQRVAIADPQTGIELPDGLVGEIWASGPSMAQGYWNRPEQSDETFNAYLKGSGPNKNGQRPFLRTGDLGFVHQGELFVTGRLKDLIIVAGRNHYPQDLESSAQEEHILLRPGCGAAFTLDFDNQEHVVLVQEVERQWKKHDLDALMKSMRRAVSAAHDVPLYAVVLVKPGGVPKTSSGKIQRAACRRLFLDGDLPQIAQWSRQPLEAAAQKRA